MADTIGKRVKEAREALSMTQIDLANAMRVSQPTIANWEASVHNPSRTRIRRLAEVLGRDAEWLEFGSAANQNEGNGAMRHYLAPMRNVPLISWVKAGKFEEVTDPYEPGTAEDWVHFPSKAKSLIALIVEDDSMNIEFPPNSIIIVDYSDTTLLDGKFYVFRSEGKATFKRYRSGPARLEPYSTNPSHEPIFPRGPIHVVGRVIAHFKRH